MTCNEHIRTDPPLLLHHATWPDVERYLETSDGIIVPIGSTEQHGPNGLIGTDAICPEVIAHGISERDGVLVAPTISVGMAQHHLAFPGSITLRPSTLMAVINDTVESLQRHGFGHIYFLNGHGGNIATINASFSEVWAKRSLGDESPEQPALRLRQQNWWNASGIMALSRKHFGDAEGSHATPSEVSLTYYAYPEQVRDVTMDPKRAPNGYIRDAADYRNTFPDGRIGSEPQLATAEIGEELYRCALDGIASDYQSFLLT